MNRRKFNTASLISLFGAATCQSAMAQSMTVNTAASFSTLKNADGMLLKLYKKQFATTHKDDNQYILTFDVFKQQAALTEKIYNLVDNRGKKHDIFMSPVNNNQLQAVFNHCTNA